MIGHANSYLRVEQLFKFRLTLITFSIKSSELFPHLQWEEPRGKAYVQRRVSKAFLIPVPGGGSPAEAIAFDFLPLSPIVES